MIINNKEYFDNRYYFFLKENSNGYSLYFCAQDTLTEARKKDEVVKFKKDKEKDVKKYLKKTIKDKNKKTTNKLKDELEELVTRDGSLANSEIPILNPILTPKKTMDQTVAAARITNDPITRGYRTYFGEEEVKEEDMSKAFGYEETKDLPPKQTVKKLKKMGVEDPVGRAKEMGKDPKLDKKKKKGADMRLRLQEKEKIDEIQKQKMIKVLEDILAKKDNGDADVNKKEVNVSKIFKKNIKSLKKQAEKEGLTISELIKLLKSE